MTDVVVTVPAREWAGWIAEGDLPGEAARYVSHFLLPARMKPVIATGERVYIVAHGKLRGYAPLIGIEDRCQISHTRRCLMRGGGAEAVTIPNDIRGFQGFRYRWWLRESEAPFPDWQRP